MTAYLEPECELDVLTYLRVLLHASRNAMPKHHNQLHEHKGEFLRDVWALLDWLAWARHGLEGVHAVDERSDHGVDVCRELIRLPDRVQPGRLTGDPLVKLLPQPGIDRGHEEPSRGHMGKDGRVVDHEEADDVVTLIVVDPLCSIASQTSR